MALSPDRYNRGVTVPELIRDNRAGLVEGLVTRILEDVPQYARVPGPELTESIEGFVDDLLALLEGREGAGLTGRLVELSQRRFTQGFQPGDFLRAILQVHPLLRPHVRTLRADDPAFAKEYDAFERILHDAAATAANVYVETVTHQIEAKNQALNRLNQRLVAQERLLTQEVAEASYALEASQEFTQRMVDSLSSGVVAVRTDTLNVTYFSSRAEEILGIPAEDALGRPVGEAVRPIEGVDADALVEVVRRAGRLPLTRARIRLPDGRRRAIYLRAERMYDAQGHAEGTVVVVEDVTERELLLDSFSRYVSHDVLQRLLARGEARLEGERRACSVLFADVRGFSGLAENLAPEVLHELLNAYFRVMIEAITDQGGFIDKFMGDKVMAIFGASGGADAGARAAVRAAREIQARVSEANRDRDATGRPPIEVGIGVNTGEVLLGNVGSEERMNFTAIGDVVNVADRLQALARAGQVLVGPETASRLGDAQVFKNLGPTPIRGRHGSVDVFELR